jgi:glycosyltransferase involved in cell wall biosynthesis
MAPWCTVVVPLFNGKRYLDELISSMIRSADETLNYLFIDDASSDESVEIVLASQLPGLQLIRNEQNIGLYATINKALNKIKTDYVSLLFQDDVVENIYFEQMKQLAETYVHASFLWSEITIIDEASRECSKGLDTGRVEVIPPGVDAWRDAVRRGTFWTISGSVSKTARLRHYGFRPDLPHCGDYDLLLRAIREDSFVYFERPLINIRVHPGQAGAKNSGRSVDFVERLAIYRDHKSRFGSDFDLSLRLETCRRELWHAGRRALGQAGRGDFRQACSTLTLLPNILRSTLW